LANFLNLQFGLGLWKRSSGGAISGDRTYVVYLRCDGVLRQNIYDRLEVKLMNTTDPEQHQKLTSQFETMRQDRRQGKHRSGHQTISVCIIHCESKNFTLSFERNFGKYCPILTILSLLQTEISTP